MKYLVAILLTACLVTTLAPSVVALDATSSDPVGSATGGLVQDPLHDPVQLVEMCAYQAQTDGHGHLTSCGAGYVSV